MKSKVIVILLGIIVFLLGGVAGAVSHYLYREHIRQAFLKDGSRQYDVVEGMAKELKLDSKQKENLRIIFNDIRNRTLVLNKQFRPQYEAVNKEFKPRYEAINKDFMPQFEVIRKESDHRIQSILRDDQKVLFEKFLRNIYQRPQRKYDANKSPSPQ